MKLGETSLVECDLKTSFKTKYIPFFAKHYFKKEKLYEETLFLKSKINEFKDENTKLKARISNVEVFIK